MKDKIEEIHFAVYECRLIYKTLRATHNLIKMCPDEKQFELDHKHFIEELQEKLDKVYDLLDEWKYLEFNRVECKKWL